MRLEDWTGVLLVGGASRRMGRDKLLLELADGRRLVQVPAAALSATCRELLAPGLGPAHAPFLPGFRAVPDAVAGAGPLGGLVAGLEACRTPWALVLAGDLPGAGPWLHALQVAAAEEPGMPLVPVDETGRLQPLSAAWPAASAPALRRLLEAGERSLQRILESVPHRTWPYDAARRAARLEHPFRNVNRPEDWAALKERRP